MIGLNANFAHGLIEVDGAEHHAMIGESGSAHPVFVGLVGQQWNAPQTI